VSATLGGLAPGTTYQYRLVARNAGGTTTGATRTFRTATATPAASGGGDTQPSQPSPQQPAPQPPGPAPGPAPLPPPGPVRDAVAPRASLAISRQTLDHALKHGLSIKLKSNEPGRAVTRILVAPSALGRRSRQAQLVIGTRATRITRAGTTTVVVKLSSTARRLLKRSRSVKLWVETSVTDGAGNRSAPTRVAVKLRAAR
jgi:hypothetical protein